MADTIPSAYPHPLYRITKTDWSTAYDSGTSEIQHPEGTTANPKPGAELVSSQIVGTPNHTVMIDLDVPATLVPSSTILHSHLYIDVAMPWWKYKDLLRALWKAGVIEKEYYKMSVKRGHSSLRVPWKKK